MTVNVTSAFTPAYTANGATTVFPFGFAAMAADEVSVLVNGAAGSGFTVTLNADQSDNPGGSVTFATAPVNGATVLIISAPDFEQDVSFENAGAFLPSSHDTVNDRAAVRDIYLKAGLARSLRGPDGESIAPLPSATNREGKFLGFGPGGAPAMLSGTGNDTALRTDLALSGGYALVNRKPAGATGDGVASDTAAITTANAASGHKFLPDGVYLTTLASTALDGPFYGFGQIKDSDGNKRAPIFTAVKAAPASSGDWNQIATAFNGDLSHVVEAIEHRVTGAAAGAPTTGYLYTRETSARVVYSQNESGHNEGTSGNAGRTAVVVEAGKLAQHGQGDHVYFSIAGEVGSTARAGATDFLANPAITWLNGTFTAVGHGCYLNFIESDAQLGAYDAAAIGHVVNITRTTGDTGNGLGAVTGGFRVQSKGTYAVDWALNAYGLHKVGVDLSTVTFTAAKAAFAVPSGGRYYGNAVSTDTRKATGYGTDWFERSASGWDHYFNNVLAWRVSDGGGGYGTGAGGAVTQATSKATGVTLNKVCGQITLNNAALAASTTATFTVTNSKVAATDTVIVNLQGGNATAGTYQVWVEAVAAGSFKVNVRNISAGSLSEALILNFAVLKAVAA